MNIGEMTILLLAIIYLITRFPLSYAEVLSHGNLTVNETHEIRITDCSKDGTIRHALKGTFSVDLNSKHMVYCYWHIIVPNGFVMMVRTTLKSKKNTPSSPCSHTNRGVSITETLETSKYTSCVHKQYLSKTSSVFLKVYSIKDDKRQNSAFQAKFESLLKNETWCSSVPIQMQATNNWKMIPVTRPENENCSWLITAPENKRIRLNLSDFNLQAEDYRACARNYVIVRDGNSVSSPVLARHCGYGKKCPIISGGRFLLIYLMSTKSNNNQRFQAFYRAVSASEITTELRGSGHISSISYHQKDAHLKCLWVLTVRQKHLVQLDVSNAVGKSCKDAQQTLKIHDGPSLKSPLINQLLFYEANKQVLTSSGRHVLIHFDPDPRGKYLNCSFYLKFRNITSTVCPTSDAAGQLSGNGTLRSPFWPNFYPNNLRCKWQISTPRQHQVIRFSVSDFALAQAGDYLMIQDANTGKLMRNLTKYTSPNTKWHSLNTSKIFVIFITDNELTHRGFSIRYISSEQDSVETSNIEAKTDKEAQDRLHTYIGLGIGLLAFILLIALGVFIFVRRKRRAKMAYVSNDPWEITSDQVELLEELGEGAFGKVWKGKLHIKILRNSMSETEPLKMRNPSITRLIRDTNQENTVAVKVLHGHASSQEQYEFLREIDLMKTVGYHKNIISMLACCTNEKITLLVVEFAKHGDLLNFLRARRKKDSLMLSSKTTSDKGDLQDVEILVKDLISFSWQIAQGMEYLSSKGIVHRDLASRNVLVNEDTVKIADFGLSRQMSYKYRMYKAGKTIKLPIKWMSPEAIYDLTFTIKSDVWSFGVVLWEMFSMGGAPYPAINNRQLLKELKKGHRMEKPDLCPDKLYALMMDCWKDVMEERPLFGEIIQRIENLMTTDEPYLELFKGINEEDQCYLVPSFNSLPESDSDDEKVIA